MRRLNAVYAGQIAPIPAKAESDGPQRVAAAHDVLPTGDTITLVAIDDLHTTARRRGCATDQRAGDH
ncbi:hypothetical protein F753_00775 [Stutzerimonas chloritidismutans AW-1]|uniref:Uncharacterized protein n=1 Tax=Stutzerimonas chloritidismutans AW-1 TaxID=1263865 RepID=V4S8W2_STUCH|nr:hypothetical protein F753_00775 [Stutzerimonas chloritidismutans AW-1]